MAGEAPSRNHGSQGQRTQVLMILYFVAVQLAFAALVALECGLVILLAGISAEQCEAPRWENCEIEVVYDV